MDLGFQNILSKKLDSFNGVETLRWLPPVVAFFGVLLCFYIGTGTFYINVSVDMYVDQGSAGKIYWREPGNNFSESRARSFKISPGERKTYEIKIPLSRIHSLRLDPTNKKSSIRIYEIRVSHFLSSLRWDYSNNFIGWQKNSRISSYQIKSDHLFLEAESNDPFIIYRSIPLNTSIVGKLVMMFSLILVLTVTFLKLTHLVGTKLFRLKMALIVFGSLISMLTYTYVLWNIKPHQITVDMEIERGQQGEILTGNFYSKMLHPDKVKFTVEPGVRKKYKLDIPFTRIDSLRLDLSNVPSEIKIYSIELSNLYSKTTWNANNLFQGWRPPRGGSDFQIVDNYLYFDGSKGNARILNKILPLHDDAFGIGVGLFVMWAMILGYLYFRSNQTRLFVSLMVGWLSITLFWRVLFLRQDDEFQYLNLLQILSKEVLPEIAAISLGIFLINLLGSSKFTSAKSAQLGRVLVVAFYIFAIYSLLIRTSDYVYYYYSGKHIDLMVLNHIKGSSVSMDPTSQLIFIIGFFIILYGVFGFLVWKNLFLSSTRITIGGTAYSLLGVTFLLSGLIQISDKPSNWRVSNYRINNYKATISPEVLGARLFDKFYFGDPIHAKIDQLPPKLVNKLNHQFGLNIRSDQKYPFFKENVFTHPFKPKIVYPVANPNVIVIFIESMSANMLSVYNSKLKGVNPNLEQFRRQSTVFYNHFSSSTPTVNGLWSSLGSYYPPVSPYKWHRQGIDLNVRGLGTFLKASGYQPFFIINMKRDYVHTGGMLERLGFKVYDEDNIAQETNEFGRAWGFSDHQVLRYLQKKMEEYDDPDPVFFGIKTIDSHVPFYIPSDGVKYANGADQLKNVSHNFDHAFGIFWQYFKNSKYAKNTLLIVTADHAAFPGTLVSRAMGKDMGKVWYDTIPLIIYDPIHELGKSVSTVSSQIDLTPTILHLLNINSPNSFIGHSIFDDRSSYPNLLATHEYHSYINQQVGKQRSIDHFELDNLQWQNDCNGSTVESSSPLTRCEYLTWFKWHKAILANNLIWP